MSPSRSLVSLSLLIFMLPACQNANPITSQQETGVTSKIPSPSDAAQAVVHDSPLISVAELQTVLESPDVRIFEVGQEKETFDEGHIPGVQYVHWITDITDPSKAERYNIIDLPTMEKLLGRLGIKPHTRIIIYDRLNSRISTRLYWSLKFYNHAKVQIVDGGFEAWARNNTPTPDVLPVDATSYKIDKKNENIITNLAFIQKHLNDPNVKLVDGRPVAQFTGEKPGAVFHTGKEHKHRGHIPGAVNIFWKDNFKADGTFKSIDELQKLYASAGVNADQCVVTYCNEGLHAAPPWFVLTELLGHKDVRIYDDSMSEWANSDQPTETSDAGK